MTALRRAAYVLLAAVVAMALSACAAIDQYKAERSQARIASAASRCEAIGYPRNSVEHLACTRELYGAAEAEEVARRAAALALGIRLLTTPPPAPSPPQLCTTRWFAGQWVTTCQ